MQPLGVRLYYAGGTFSMKLILASASARRAEILHDAGLSFSVLSSAVDETPMAGETPGGGVERRRAAQTGVVSAPARGGAPYYARHAEAGFGGSVLAHAPPSDEPRRAL